MARTDRLTDVPFSPVRHVFARAMELEAQGRDILHFSLGRPDFDTPDNVKQAAVDALRAGQVHYTSNYGIPELGAAIADKLRESIGLHYEPGAEIIPTSGVGEGVLSTFLALLEPGDEVVVIKPAWHHYAVAARLAGARPVAVPTGAEDGFVPDPDAIVAALTSRTRLLVINTPNNPTGVVYPEALLRTIGEIAADRDLIVVSDEIYESLVYEGQHVSIAALDENRDRTVVLNGLSKSHSMTGWRIGYVACPRPLAERIMRVHQHNTVCPTTFVQHGAVEAYRGDQSRVADMRREFAARRDLACRLLMEFPGVDLVTPTAAFYAFPRFSFAGEQDAAELLLEEAGVACIPGRAFGAAYREHVRFSFCSSAGDITRGMERIGALAQRRRQDSALTQR